jgi:hypothetical protein
MFIKYFFHRPKVLEQLHPSLTAHDEALYYVENLCLRLLTNLVVDQPRTIPVSFVFFSSAKSDSILANSLVPLLGCRRKGSKNISDSHRQGNDVKFSVRWVFN